MSVKTLVPVNPANVKQGDRVSTPDGTVFGVVTDASHAHYDVLYVDWGSAGPVRTCGVQRVNIKWVRSVL